MARKWKASPSMCLTTLYNADDKKWIYATKKNLLHTCITKSLNLVHVLLAGFQICLQWCLDSVELLQVCYILTIHSFFDEHSNPKWAHGLSFHFPSLSNCRCRPCSDLKRKNLLSHCWVLSRLTLRTFRKSFGMKMIAFKAISAKKEIRLQPWNRLIDQKSHFWSVINSSRPPLLSLLSVCFTFVMPSPCPENFSLLTKLFPPWLLWSVCCKAWH